MDKICGRCKESKDSGEFNKDENTKDGLQCLCTLCSRASNKAYRLASSLLSAAYAKAYDLANKEDLASKNKADAKAYYLAHKDKRE